MIHKDRYSQAFLFALLTSAASLYLFRQEQYGWAAALMAPNMLPVGYLAGLMYSPAKAHVPDKLKNHPDIEYKSEGDCGFTKAYTPNIDGLRIKGVRYKFVNGTDACINEDLSVRPCFLGSQIMQRIAKAGKEPSKIQGDECWE